MLSQIHKADFSLLEYSIGRFSSSTDSDATVAAPSSARLESTFCRNFTCCGRDLDDLHDLLQHYEECHVRFEDDEIPSMMTDEELDETSSIASDAPSAQSSTADESLHGSNSKNMELKRPRPSVAGSGPSQTPMVSTAAEDLEHPSAFETTVMRSPSVSRGKKRALGHSNGAAPSNANPLFRALVENGGRHPLGMSSAYTHNSPFSSPANSRPGTPSIDSENEAFFGSTTQNSMFSNLSLRTNQADDQLPSCAPPNLFFPSASANTQRPAKRERFSTATGPSNPPSTMGSSTPLAAPAQTNADNEHRPYKCPAPGCDKAYKQMNGLKYHRLHGHCNQNLRNVSSPVAASPADSLPRPGTPTAPSKESSPAPSSETRSAVPVLQAPPDLRAFGITTTGPSMSTPSTPQHETPGSPGDNSPLLNQTEKTYVCQVGNCDKRYKNLNGLRYHYLHSGSHGLLGLQLLHANGGGASAKADSVSGRPPVSTDTLSREQIVQAAAAAQALLNQQGPCVKNTSGASSNLSAAAFLASVGNGTLPVSNNQPL